MVAISLDEAALLCDQCQSITDPKRILILYALNERERNVTELAEELRFPQSTVSRHMQKLVNCGTVRGERNGPAVIYSLTDPRLIDVMNIMRTVLVDTLRRRAELVDLIS